MNKIENLNFDILFSQDVFKQPNVSVVHYNSGRNWSQLYHNYNYDNPNSTPCVVGIIDIKNPKTLSLGVAVCNPIDNYNKKIARSIAYARAKYTTGTTYHIQEILGNYVKEHDKKYHNNPYTKLDLFRDIIRNNKNKLTFYDLSLAAVINYAYRESENSGVIPWYSIINQLDYQIFDEYNKRI